MKRNKIKLFQLKLFIAENGKYSQKATQWASSRLISAIDQSFALRWASVLGYDNHSVRIEVDKENFYIKTIN